MAFYRCNGGGEKVAIGSFSWSTSGSTTIDLGFKPKYLCVRDNTSSPAANIYNSDISTTSFIYAGGGTYTTTKNLPSTVARQLYSINDTGFTINRTATSGAVGYYFAIG